MNDEKDDTTLGEGSVVPSNLADWKWLDTRTVVYGGAMRLDQTEPSTICICPVDGETVGQCVDRMLGRNRYSRRVIVRGPVLINSPPPPSSLDVALWQYLGIEH
jgi:hypothetical protein